MFLKNSFLIFLFVLLPYQLLNAQNFASFSDSSLVLSNGLIERKIVFENGNIYTKNLKLNGSDLNFSSGEPQEFSLIINGLDCNGLSGWNLISFSFASDDYQGNGATVKLLGTKEFKDIEVDITYLLYPQLPVIRKQISIVNNTDAEIMIESFDIEKLILGFNFVSSVVYKNYARQKHLSTYIGDWNDPVIAVHSYSHNAGILLGNESPGVLKRTAYNTDYNNIGIGLTHREDNYPFRKYIKNGEHWASPRVFVIPYVHSSDPWQVVNTSLADFTRRHLGLRINELSDRPTVMYNNWNPFRDNISDTLIISLAKVASEIGVTHFTLDAGWYTTYENMGKDVSWIDNMGDFVTDKRKFPNGLKPVFDEIRELGLEPGLWISVGSASKASKVLQDHPEWAVRNEKGELVNLHSPDSKRDQWTICFGTEWMEYIKNKILELVRDLGLSYVKLDLSVVTSAYSTEINKAGCAAKDHPHHKDREESLIIIYERLFRLFDELHEEAPDLYIDCTFETAGKLQLIDYAFCQHAEGNWLTNIYDPFPVGTFRIRNLAWWKSPVIPASSLIIGNLKMDSPEFIHELKTLTGSFPVTLGDLRKLSEDKKMEIRQWTNWISEMQKKYSYDLYRQDLIGFGEPMEGAWDGWSRINTDTKKGGIVGVFKESSLDNERTVAVPGLNKTSQYKVKTAPAGNEITTLTGEELANKGFKVIMTEKYDSKLFEIQIVNK